MTPTEELYHVGRDPLELANLVQKGSDDAALGTMRSLYDREVEKWRRMAVDYNNYRDFAVFFDRAIPWEEKRDLGAKSKRPRK